ncbi:MAG: PolC-type DNA polymerase III [Firmicutes bacterium]|nr:PolC-type DNA polymerase III [Bacillota bacterium]
MKKEFLNIENTDYHSIFDILNVKVYPKNQSWDIYITPKVLIDSDKLASIKNFFSKTYKVKNIKLICKYLSKQSYLSKIFNDNWNQIIEIVLLENPGLTGFLSDSYIEFEEGTLIITTVSKNAWSFLTDKNLDKILKEIMIKYYNMNLVIKLKYMEEVKKELDFGEDIENEEKKIINDALKNYTDNTGKNIKNKQNTIYGKKINNAEILSMEKITEESGSVVVEGTIFYVEAKQLNNGNKIINFYITDYNNSINCKMFLKQDSSSKVNDKLIEGKRIKIKGDIKLDSYTKDIILYPNSIVEIPQLKRSDNAKIKRVELHAHTNMSAMDGIAPVTDLIKRAKEWGHKAIAITDHGIVQAFPEAYEASKKYGIKVLYGVEGYLVNDEIPIVYNSRSYDFDDEFVVFDIETTGLSSVNDKITEIGAVIIKDRKVIASYNSLINPEVSIPLKIVKLTGITNSMVSGERTIDKVLPEFLSFAGDRPLVAHNALFDWGFIKNKSEELGYEIKNTIIDTLELSRNLLTIKKHRLNDLCDYFGINLLNHHRAKDDSEATAKVLFEMFKLLEKKKIYNISDMNRIIKKSKNKSLESYHIIIIAKNQKGLYNLYKLISLSHIDYFYKKPRILRSILEEYKDDLIIGSACEAGEIFRLIQRNVDSGILLQRAKLYDYFEIQPLANNQFLIDNGSLTKEKLVEINRKIIDLARILNKPVVATGDLHFIDPTDEVFRRILMAGQGYKDADNQAPLYFKTTDEMLEEFNYLGSDLAYEIVVNNSILIADTVENIVPIPEETFPPKIDGADKQIYKMAMDKAYAIYGENLPHIVKNRLETELNSIINNGYAVMYLIAHKLVAKSLQDGYLVGSRGSVGSSFVATMCDITEVNPLPPHYICPNCRYSYFYTDHSVGSGADLEDKLCPNCNEELIKDGHDIPFEVFLGLEGNKEPDIDLNFAGEYQATAHKYAEEIFGLGHVFRAGTIGTLQEKTAYGFVKKYFDERHKNLNHAEMKRLITGCTGIKRTTGQHPGGIMVVPADHEIYEFTPIQKPADDINSSIVTTHFDYRSISGRLLKLDILGHDVPTIIRMLEDITGFKADKIKFDDKVIMSLFTSTEALNVNLEDIDCKIGTLGIPEFGTKFVRQMLIDTRPTTFAELVRISGLSHGTDVWLNNAQDLIKNEVASLKEVISTRDDIMLYLIHKGVSPKSAFKIAENVRKGKGLDKEHEEVMKDKNIPEWYIDSCKIIKYLFPKAHATAYVMMSLRIAYYKIYYPEAFYASYYTVRIEDFDTDFFIKDINFLKKKWIEFNKKGNNATIKEKNLMTVLEVVYEMYSRGIKLLPVDLYKSSMKKFIITKDGILPPLMTLQGLGINAAISIVKERKKSSFISIEDLKNRTKLSKSVIEILKEHGCVDDLPEENQLSLF